MQTREKEVVFGGLSVEQFKDLLFNGVISEVGEEDRDRNKPHMSEKLLSEGKSEMMVDENGNVIVSSKAVESQDSKSIQQS